MGDAIKKKIRDEIKKSSFSFTIHLCHCRLNEFPNRLIEATPTLLALRRLDLSSNNISEIPAAIGGFVELRELWLQSNPIITLPKEIENLTKIEVIDLKYTKVMELPSEMCNLKKLYDLDFTETPFAARALQRYEVAACDHGGLQALKRVLREEYQRQCLAADTLELLMGELYLKEADNPQAVPIVKSMLQVGGACVSVNVSVSVHVCADEDEPCIFELECRGFYLTHHPHMQLCNEEFSNLEEFRLFCRRADKLLPETLAQIDENVRVGRDPDRQASCLVMSCCSFSLSRNLLLTTATFFSPL